MAVVVVTEAPQEVEAVSVTQTRRASATEEVRADLPIKRFIIHETFPRKSPLVSRFPQVQKVPFPKRDISRIPTSTHMSKLSTETEIISWTEKSVRYNGFGLNLLRLYNVISYAFYFI